VRGVPLPTPRPSHKQAFYIRPVSHRIPGGIYAYVPEIEHSVLEQFSQDGYPTNTDKALNSTLSYDDNKRNSKK